MAWEHRQLKKKYNGSNSDWNTSSTEAAAAAAAGVKGAQWECGTSRLPLHPRHTHTPQARRKTRRWIYRKRKAKVTKIDNLKLRKKTQSVEEKNLYRSCEHKK